MKSEIVEVLKPGESEYRPAYNITEEGIYLEQLYASIDEVERTLIDNCVRRHSDRMDEV